jgi:transcription factor STE12
LLTSSLRHRRIHEAQHDGQPPFTHEDDLENDAHDFGSPEDDMSPPAHAQNMIHVPHMAPIPGSMSVPSAMQTVVAPHMIAPQLLQQQL